MIAPGSSAACEGDREGDFRAHRMTDQRASMRRSRCGGEELLWPALQNARMVGGGHVTATPPKIMRTFCGLDRSSVILKRFDRGLEASNCGGRSCAPRGNRTPNPLIKRPPAWPGCAAKPTPDARQRAVNPPRRTRLPQRRLVEWRRKAPRSASHSTSARREGRKTLLASKFSVPRQDSNLRRTGLGGRLKVRSAVSAAYSSAICAVFVSVLALLLAIDSTKRSMTHEARTRRAGA